MNALSPLWFPLLATLASTSALAQDPTGTLEPPPVPYKSLFFADYDGDELPDAFVVHPAGTGRLLRNTGGGAFIDVSERAGLAGVSGAHMAAWGDANGDGRLDLYLPAWRGTSRLFVQTGDGSFVDETGVAGLPLWAEPLDARWLDVDDDGHLDLHLTTLHDELVYRNDGRGHFEKLDLGLEPRIDALADSEAGAERPATVDAARALRGLAPAGEDGSTNGPGAPGNLDFQIVCAIGIQDQSNPLDCMSASSTPTMGMLYPISNEWYIAPSGNVGLGTTSPGRKLDVAGDIRSSAQLISTAPSGTAPLVVGSGTRVNNLNADRLDGLHGSAFAQLPVDGGDIADGAVTGAKLAPNAVSSGSILNGSVTASDLGNDSVGAAEVQTNAIGASELAPGVVSDVHVDIAAAIQGTKIAPNFGGQHIVTGGMVAATGDMVSGAHVLATYGTAADPSFRFDLNEATGIASPVPDVLMLISDGQALLTLSPDGRVIVGDSFGVQDTRFYSEMGDVAGVGQAIFGNSTDPSGPAIGVDGWCASTGGYGVNGRSSAASGVTYGVRAVAVSPDGAGVRAHNYGDGPGLYATSDGATGAGAYAEGYMGLEAFTDSDGGIGVHGVADATSGFADGVSGRSYDFNGYGVYGTNLTANGVGVAALGDLVASGTKFFAQPHPNDADKVVRFVCLEGNEAGTYFRGSAATVDGVATIDVPEVFRMVSDPDEITVQVTRRGPGDLWVESVDLERVVVRGDVDVEFDYFVNGVRLGYRDVQLIADNRLYVPTERGVPYGAHLPDDVRQLLVDNGTLNPDFTPNEATAATLGWKLSEPGAAEAARERGRALRRQDQAVDAACEARTAPAPAARATFER